MPIKKPVQTREERLQTMVAYGGCSSEFADQARRKCLKHAERSFTQTHQCQELSSIMAFITVADAVLIIHAPVGCAGCATVMNPVYRRWQMRQGLKPKDARWLSSNLDEQDIIHGGEEKLRCAIRLAEQRHHPRVIFVFTSCASAIIGDDVANIIIRLQPEVQGKLVLVECEGFRSKVSASGYDSALHAVINYLLEEPAQKEPDLVNVVSPLSVSASDRDELEGLIGVLGLRANFLPNFATADGLKRSTGAVASTSVCLTYGEYFVSTMTKRYGIPHTRAVMPLGIENTDQWLLQLAALVGKSAEAEVFIASEHERILSELTRLRAELKGKRIFVSAGSTRAVTLAALADELGFQLVGLNTYHYDEVIAASLEKLVARQGNFLLNVANMQPFEQANLLNRLQPDLYLGVSSWAAKQGIATVVGVSPLGSTFGFGYNGVIKVGTKLAEALENPGFNLKLAQHKKLPYRASWYEEDPFAHIVPFGGEEL